MYMSRILMCILAVIMLITGCSKQPNTDNLTLKDIAYDVNKEHGYTIYIREDAAYIPYLVLTNDYNGQALLLRKNILEEDQIFNNSTSYYKDSYIDKYLNEEFISKLDTSIQESIVATNIKIATESSLLCKGTAKDTIKRKIFLLSITEVSTTNDFTGDEGEFLKYFKKAKHRIAYRGKEVAPWYLRTSYTTYSSMAWVVTTKGYWTMEGTSKSNGIRPAFCLDKDTSIKISDKIGYGENVFVIN